MLAGLVAWPAACSSHGMNPGLHPGETVAATSRPRQHPPPAGHAPASLPDLAGSRVEFARVMARADALATLPPGGTGTLLGRPAAGAPAWAGRNLGGLATQAATRSPGSQQDPRPAASVAGLDTPVQEHAAAHVDRAPAPALTPRVRGAGAGVPALPDSRQGDLPALPDGSSSTPAQVDTCEHGTSLGAGNVASGAQAESTPALTPLRAGAPDQSAQTAASSGGLDDNGAAPPAAQLAAAASPDAAGVALGAGGTAPGDAPSGPVSARSLSGEASGSGPGAGRPGPAGRAVPAPGGASGAAASVTLHS